MEKNINTRTAEFVSPMHPDKICDQISASVLDECLKQDPNSRLAIETLGGHGKIVVMGEITSNAKIDIKNIASKELESKDFEILINVSSQSTEIARGVDNGGAGDQGIMIGYACSETINLMPLEYELARDLCRWIYNKYPYDGKVQITIEGNNFKTILVSWCNVSKEELESKIKMWFYKLIKTYIRVYQADDFELLINPAGDWSQGGFDADTGLTGRKIVVDAYGPRVSVGGGAFSGKDATKVDMSGALMARKVAVETLKLKNCKEVLVEVAYAIGKKGPLSVEIIADGIKIDVDQKTINRFEVKNIIQELKLRDPQFKNLSKWGHFGNNNIWDN